MLCKKVHLKISQFVNRVANLYTVQFISKLSINVDNPYVENIKNFKQKKILTKGIYKFIKQYFEPLNMFRCSIAYFSTVFAAWNCKIIFKNRK